MKRIRTETTVETEDIVVLSVRGRRSTGWCAKCAAQVDMLCVSGDAESDSVRTIRRLARDDRLHVTETPEGDLLVCLNHPAS